MYVWGPGMDQKKDTQRTRIIIREDEDPIRPDARRTIARRGTRIYGQPGSRTRVGLDSNTRLYEKQPAGSDPGTEKRSGKKSPKEVIGGIAAFARGVYTDLRNVRVRDSAKFARFLKVIGVFALVLLLEVGYFIFDHRVEGMPEEIKETQKELELTQKENVILQEEIDELGGYDSIEEQKRSWERLKEKVEKAAAETSY